MIKPIVFLQPGVIIIYGTSIDTDPHSHNAIQVVWPKYNSRCQFNNNHLSGLLIVNSQVEHQLHLSEGWILLIEPKSDLGHAVSSQLKDQPYKTFDSFFTDTIKPSLNADSVVQYLAPLQIELNLTSYSLTTNKSKVEDQRIQQLLIQLDQCFNGECIKPFNWRASQVASQLALSESRFLHLFSDQLGIAWRPYLLWRRMICAIKAILDDSSATDAAYLAGFSDSAHLSRTFRSYFGMTIRQARGLFNKD